MYALHEDEECEMIEIAKIPRGSLEKERERERVEKKKVKSRQKVIDKHKRHSGKPPPRFTGLLAFTTLSPRFSPRLSLANSKVKHTLMHETCYPSWKRADDIPISIKSTTTNCLTLEFQCMCPAADFCHSSSITYWWFVYLANPFLECQSLMREM